MSGELICVSLNQTDLVTEADFKVIVTRSLKQEKYWNGRGWIWARELGPSSELFNKVQQYKDQKIWGPELFESFYAPNYLNQLHREGTETNDLFKGMAAHLSSGAIIAICCYCSSHSACHLSLLSEELRKLSDCKITVLQSS